MGRLLLRVSYRVWWRSAGEAVTVHPLAQATILPQQQGEDSRAGHVLEAVELAATTEANANATLERIDGHAGDSVAADGVDLVHGVCLN